MISMGGSAWMQKKYKKGRTNGGMSIGVRKVMKVDFNIINNRVELIYKNMCAIIFVFLNEKKKEIVIVCDFNACTGIERCSYYKW